MIRILIDHDIVAIPEPAIDKPVIVWRDGEIVAVKPEAVSAPASQVKHMPRTETAREASVFEWTRDTIVWIAASGVMPDPCTVGVNVRSFRMSSPVGEPPVLWHGWLHSGWLLSSCRRRAARGNMPPANLTVLPALRKSRDKCHGQHCKNPNCFFH